MFTDPVLKNLTMHYPPPLFKDRSNFLFEDLIETIISQQLSLKAAESIFNRFKGLFGNAFPSPDKILAMEEGNMRIAGLSGSKERYIRNVSQAFLDKRIIIKDIKSMDDNTVIETLISIKGIGKWSAEMILIFTLNRPDVFSVSDLGLRRAIQNLYGVTDNHEILLLADTWRPYRSSACWYLWRSLENEVAR